jgi:hypothetical protein
MAHGCKVDYPTLVAGFDKFLKTTWPKTDLAWELLKDNANGRITMELTKPYPPDAMAIRLGELRYTVGKFDIYIFPACCGASVLSNLNIQEPKMNAKLRPALITLAERIILQGGYTKAIATGIVGSPFTEGLKEHGYKEIDAFLNARTNHDLTVLAKNLRARNAVAEWGQ